MARCGIVITVFYALVVALLLLPGGFLLSGEKPQLAMHGEWATCYGVVTGLAIMLLAFGPGVMALYKKKMDAYRARMHRD